MKKISLLLLIVVTLCISCTRKEASPPPIEPPVERPVVEGFLAFNPDGVFRLCGSTKYL